MYETSYSGRVIDELRRMIARNPAHPARILAAVREIDKRLRIYPQFGQPLRDLSVANTRLWIGSVVPLVVQYVVVEPDTGGSGRQVMVVRPFTPLPHAGII